METKGLGTTFLACIPALTPPLVETAMCFAIRAALADGTMDQREQDALILMGRQLGMTLEIFVQIYEVVVMMERAAYP